MFAPDAADKLKQYKLEHGEENKSEDNAHTAVVEEPKDDMVVDPPAQPQRWCVMCACSDSLRVARHALPQDEGFCLCHHLFQPTGDAIHLLEAAG